LTVNTPIDAEMGLPELIRKFKVAERRLLQATPVPILELATRPRPKPEVTAESPAPAKPRARRGPHR
jgi:hypothetical protein